MENIIINITSALDQLRQAVPLIHNMTNYVTVNDVANAVLAIGASPIMADDIQECEDITAISSALVVNIGTLNHRTVASMLASGQKANALGIPVVFDPVGAGASALRNQTALTFLEKVKVSVIRGNLSEISFLSGLKVNTKGVDSAEQDEKNNPVLVAKSVAKAFNCTVALTGETDIICSKQQLASISNGHKLLSKVTGTGCMASALVGAYIGAAVDPFTAATGGVASMAMAGEIAFEKAGALGTGSFHMAILDALSHLTPGIINERAKIYAETY